MKLASGAAPARGSPVVHYIFVSNEGSGASEKIRRTYVEGE